MGSNKFDLTFSFIRWGSCELHEINQIFELGGGKWIEVGLIVFVVVAAGVVVVVVVAAAGVVVVVALHKFD